MANQFHAFWMQRVGRDHKYEAFDKPDDPKLQNLISENNDKYDGSVGDLVVIYGSKIEFTPVETVTKWGIVGGEPAYW
jgi:hypothetical protein